MACTQLLLRSSGKGVSGTCRVEMFLRGWSSLLRVQFASAEEDTCTLKVCFGLQLRCLCQLQHGM